MTYREYKKILNFFLICITTTILFYFVNLLNLISPSKSIFAANLFFYFFSLTSICFFIFCLYSIISKVKSHRKIEHPLVLIIIATILVITSFSWAITSYYSIYKAKDDQRLVQSIKTLVDSISMNKAFDSDKRLDAVAKYYHVTGKIEKYLDENGKITIFLPQKNDKLIYKRYADTLANLDRLLKNAETKIKILSFIFVTSIGILIFLCRFKRRKNSNWPS